MRATLSNSLSKPQLLSSSTSWSRTPYCLFSILCCELCYFVLVSSVLVLFVAAVLVLYIDSLLFRLINLSLVTTTESATMRSMVNRRKYLIAIAWISTSTNKICSNHANICRISIMNRLGIVWIRIGHHFRHPNSQIPMWDRTLSISQSTVLTTGCASSKKQKKR